LNLRRRSAPNNWRCSVHVSKTADEPLGKHVQHLFSAQDQLAGVGAPGALLSWRLRPHLMAMEPGPRGSYRVRTTRGLYVEAYVHSQTAKAMGFLDGVSDLKSAIERARVLRPWSRGKTTDLICREIHHLMNLGMLDPV
ncbi:MAG TPA: hypothetical protein VIU38_08340, partial [Anaerolineales bacterium]